MDSNNKNSTFDQVAEITLSYRPNSKLSEKPKITSSQIAERILRAHWEDSKLEFIEEFKVILLNRANRVLGIVSASSGGISGTVVDIKVIFGAAMKASASGIILSHNHPGGTLYPSERDSKITERLVKAGKLLDIPVMDHIILTADGYYSFADRGGL
ncbi:DNA repair protein [Echinicola strongylocentroti]|uniref:DNA repair protein n=1 Tax=Echinicola strongylocentroti TaxID=1795355 RepID=A0A2Z4IKU7_9BACT|nr:JAB domain-containing protein [Echinicola strongylocentroti]AWW30993.1 DNA repair protein [Echinicola strongylocentroti]